MPLPLLLRRQRSIWQTPRLPRLVLVLLLLPLLLSGCFLPRGAATPRPLTPPPGAKGTGDVIAFIPVGNFPTRTLNELADYFRQSLGVKIEVLPPMRSTFAQKRGSQVIGESLIDVLREEHTRHRFLIGFTHEDLAVQDGSLNFTFAQSAIFAQSGRGMAVISLARLEPPFKPGERGRSRQVMVQRLRKLTAKQIGRLYYGLPDSQDPGSVMYGGINSVRDIDNMSGAY